MEFTATLEDPTEYAVLMNDLIDGFFEHLSSQYASAVLAPVATPAQVDQPKEDSSTLQNYFSSFRDDEDSGFTDLSTPGAAASLDSTELPQSFHEIDVRTTNTPALNVGYQACPLPDMNSGISSPVDTGLPTPQYSVPQMMDVEPTPLVAQEVSQDTLASEPGPSSIKNGNEKAPNPTKSKKSKKIKPPVVPGNLYCARCDKNFRSARGLLQHNNSRHSGVKAHRCDDCGKLFDRAADRDTHQARHVMSNKPFPCPYEECPRAYNRAFDLNRHIADHHGNPRFGCTLCEMRYSREDHLLKHEESHRIKTVKKFKNRRV